MNPKFERREFVAPLIGLVSTAIERDLTDDAAALLAGVRVLRPRLLELDILEGWIMIKREQYRECAHLMRNLESSPTQWSLAKAMLASCQQFLKDPEWESSANAVLEGDATPDAIEMVTRLKNKGKAPAEAEPAFADGADDADGATPFAPQAVPFDMSFMFHLRA
jgi:type III secretion protein HrpB1